MVPHFMACHFSEVSKFVEVVVLVMFQNLVVSEMFYQRVCDTMMYRIVFVSTGCFVFGEYK
jgi:hypothetical protein